ncbi:alpha/beta fold hydrolase [Streptomyces pseudogriseolus]|uniref:alpha/beta fold hydrolase n=1 Tax=Streptomyces pseudogriseolus TaxID=36817 RepID=UPI003FA1E054
MSEPTAAGSLHPIRTETTTFHVSSVGPVEVTVRDRDRTRSFLLLHGGGGPATMTGFADLLAERTRSRVLVPTHPGFSGTPKNSALAGVSDLAKAYIAMLDTLDLSDVTVGRQLLRRLAGRRDRPAGQPARQWRGDQNRHRG